MSSIGLTTDCIDEPAYQFPGQLTEEEMKPVVVIKDKTVYVNVVEDADEESKYTASAVVWAIFFVILVLLVPAIFYLFCKNRKVL